MSGGDAIDARVLDSWGPTGKLVNAWGPTETCIGNTLGFVDGASSQSLVGAAYPGSTVLVIDEAKKRPALLGAEGEIAVAGPQLAEGYIGQPDLSEKSFVTLEDHRKVYLTGDAGRMLADGQLQCLGRIDKSMVKINSQRVELDEISSALRSHPEIKDASTLYVRHPAASKRQLVAFLVPQQTHPPSGSGVRQDKDAQELRDEVLEHISQHLPLYMIPVHILVLALDHLPLTVNNKVDGKALEQEYFAINLASSQSRDKDAPRALNPVELQVAAIIAEFCNIPADTIGLDQSESQGSYIGVNGTDPSLSRSLRSWRGLNLCHLLGSTDVKGV
jgi:ferricrocin synthase